MSYLEMAKRAAASYAKNAERKISSLSSDKLECTGPGYAETRECPPEASPSRPSAAALGVPSPESSYRSALREWWALTAQGAEADVAEAQQVYQEIVRLLDEVGEPRATERRRTWAREWFKEQGACPFCGEPVYHDLESPRHR